MQGPGALHMAATSYTKGEERPPSANHLISPEGDDPARPNAAAAQTAPTDVDTSFWETALADAERAEKDFRQRGRDIVQIYRGDIPITRPKAGKMGRSASYSGPQNSSTFNILYANTEVMLPAAYAKPPDPVVRSRFVKKSAVPAPPPPPPIIPGGFGLPPPAMAGGPPPPPGAGPPGEPPMPLGPSGPPAMMAPP